MLTVSIVEDQIAGDQSSMTSGATDGKKRRIIKNPQPKLNPERLMGDKGIQTVEDYFKDWESKGKGKEFDDLDVVMKKLEHWAHRLYPKLPFDNVIDVIANRLGKKKTVQTHVKKIRLGMATVPVRVGGGEDVVSEVEEEVARYGGAEEPDVFEELVKQAGGSSANLPPVTNIQVAPASGLTEEQREKMRQNKELAAKRRREKQEREQRQAEEEIRLAAQHREEEEQDEIEREMMSVAAAEKAANKTPTEYAPGADNMNLEEMLEEMNDE